jgi:nucleotide-binding universal stress UspA family protein
MKILLAIDSSAGSLDVISEVAARPWPAQTVVHILSVVDLGRSVNERSLIQAATEAARGLVKNAAERLAAAGLDTSTAVIQGHARTSIVESAEGWGADFVIVGSHGHGPVERFLLGSVAQAVIRHAPCSVEIVRSRKLDRPEASTGMRILLATDGSDCSIAAARSVAERPWPKRSEIRIISAAEITVPSIVPLYVDTELLKRIREEDLQEARKAVAAVKDIVSSTGLNVSDTIGVTSPKTAILDEAKDWEADLIVVGSHGQHGISRLLLGSVAEAVALHSKSSVEVIRQRVPGF